jgi:ribonuclease III
VLRNLRYRIKLFSSARKEFYSFIKNITGFSPLKLNLYDLAFIHKSATSVDILGNPINNERLEYLGDAVLGAIVADYLYNRFPGKDEGFLTQLRSRIVNRNFLTQLTFKMGLIKFVSSNTSTINETSHIYGDVFEAFIGAVYLDNGYKAAKRFVVKKILSEYVDIYEVERSNTNYKSQLIEWGQKNKKNVEFHTVSNPESGTNKSPFISEIFIDGEIAGRGEGFSKKEAQQNAAQTALSNQSAPES